jgi:hypothetical protein
LDLWGFGDSAKAKLRYSVSDYVALINNFVNAMGIRQFPLVGHALGATVALEYAARYPDQITKVVAISLPLTPDSISRKLINFANDSVIAKMFWRRQITYKEVQKELEKTGPGAISLSVQSVTQIDVKHRLQNLSQFKDLMVLTVYGEKDDLIDPSPTRSLNGHWPNIPLLACLTPNISPCWTKRPNLIACFKIFSTQKVIYRFWSLRRSGIAARANWFRHRPTGIFPPVPASSDLPRCIPRATYHSVYCLKEVSVKGFVSA